MDILEFSATGLAEKIRKREIGAVEAAKASLDQIEKEEKRIHAYLYWDRKAVLEQAENEDRDIRKGKIKKREPPPLAFLPALCYTLFKHLSKY